MLKYEISAAGYSKSLGRLILASSDNPPALHIYDPKTQVDSAISLIKRPTALSISPDGKFAVVGHDALVSYVDLAAQVVVKTYDVPFPVTNVTAGGNGWIYASDKGQLPPNTIGSAAIELKTGREQPGFSGDGLITPDGQSAYVEGTNADNLYHRVDISQGPPAHDQIDAAILANIQTCPPTWLSIDGKRLFTQCSDVLRASTDPTQNLSYNGKLDQLDVVSALTQSGTLGRLLAIGRSGSTGNNAPGDNNLVVYNYDTLKSEQIIDLPQFTAGSIPTPGHGRYVFFDADGLDYYVIMQADGSAGLLNDFGVVSMKLATLSPTPTITVTAPPTLAGTGSPSTSTSSSIHMLNFPVDAAVYSRALDRIIMTSSDPNELIIDNPVDNQQVTVALSRPPLSLSLSVDGLFAAIGHDAAISLVDLKAGKVLNTYDSPVPANNLYYAANGYIYILPVKQAAALYQLNVKTRAVTSQNEQFIWGSGPSILYQDGKRIYFSLEDTLMLYRVDLGDDGTASPAQQGPYSINYRQCGQIWSSEDGKRLFAGCGTVFNTNPDPKQDMTYNGTLTQSVYSDLSGVNYYAITDVPQANLIYALPYPSNTTMMRSSGQNINAVQKLLVFDYAYLQYRAILDLPQFVMPNGNSIKGQGYYMFANSQGTQLYIIMEADKGSGLLNDFGIWTTNVDPSKAAQ